MGGATVECVRPSRVKSLALLYGSVLIIMATQIREVASFAMRPLFDATPITMPSIIGWSHQPRLKNQFIIHDRSQMARLRSVSSCALTSRKSSNSCALFSLVKDSSPLHWHNVPKSTLIPGHNDQSDAVPELDSILVGCDAVIETFCLDAIDPNVWVRSFHAKSESKLLEMISAESVTKSESERGKATKRNNSLSLPTEAMEAIHATHRWSSNFVRKLQLCPWAGSSLDTVGAVRYWVLLLNNNDEYGDNEVDAIGSAKDLRAVVLNKMEDMVRQAGKHLEQITSDKRENDLDPIDPSVAISFVILVDNTAKSTPPPATIHANFQRPDFETFHEFFLDLEDKLLDECDDYWDGNDDLVDDDEDDNNTEEDGVPIGCSITIAGFHPQWQFGCENDDTSIGTNADAAIDFEKRTPHPTISIVMSSAIDALLNDETSANCAEADDGSGRASAPATERIAASNEKILGGIGIEQLKQLFEEEVLGCPENHGQ